MMPVSPSWADDGASQAAASFAKGNNVYSDPDVSGNFSQISEVTSTFSGSNVGIALLSSNAADLDGARAAQIILQNSGGKLSTVIVVFDQSGRNDTFAVAGKNADKISTFLYGAQKQDGSDAILSNSKNILQLSANTTTSVGANPPSGSGNHAVTFGIVGGILLAVIIIMAFVKKYIFDRFEGPYEKEEKVARLEPFNKNSAEVKKLFDSLRKNYELLRERNDPIADSIKNLLLHSNQLFQRLNKKGTAEQVQMAEIEYVNKFGKLLKYTGEDYYLDIKDNPGLWSESEKKLKAITSAIVATDKQLISNIQQVNDSQKLEFTSDLASLSREIEAPKIEDFYTEGNKK